VRVSSRHPESEVRDHASCSLRKKPGAETNAKVRLNIQPGPDAVDVTLDRLLIGPATLPIGGPLRYLLLRCGPDKKEPLRFKEHILPALLCNYLISLGSGSPVVPTIQSLQTTRFQRNAKQGVSARISGH
jgi:hypothetical protein